jgi:hypothetical protein
VGVQLEIDDESGMKFTTSLLRKSSSNRRVEALFSLASGGPLQIHIKPTSDYRKVWIKNIPWLDILQLNAPKEPTRDIHFAHIYKLSKDSASVAKKIPCTNGDTCLGAAPDDRHGSGTDCPIGMMHHP